MNDVFNKYCEKALEAMSKDAFRDGFGKGFAAGAHKEHEALLDSFFAAATVTKVVYNGYTTIVEFADGEHVSVVYNPDYGYAYDSEKAVMSAILKHIAGNGYISALKRFANVSDAKCEAVFVKGTTAEMLKGFQNARCNISTDMIIRDDEDDDLSIDYSPDGVAVKLTEDELFAREYDGLPDDNIY